MCSHFMKKDEAGVINLNRITTDTITIRMLVDTPPWIGDANGFTTTQSPTADRHHE